MMRPAPHTAARARDGFTIIEVVLAMFILLLGMTTILGLLSFGAATANTAQLRAASANATPAIIADLEENLFPLVTENGREVAGEPQPIFDRPVPGHPRLTYSAVAVPAPPSDADGAGVPLEYRVDVEVAWRTGGAAQSRKFSTLLLREVPFVERMRLLFVENYDPPPAKEQAAAVAADAARRETDREENR